MFLKRLVVAGVALRGDGYPNAESTVALLRRSGEWDVQDKVHWLPAHVRLWHLMRGPLPGRLLMVARLVVGGLVQAIGLLVSTRVGDFVYLPYPAPVTGWWLSLVPSRWRPGCVADAYISLWDSMFRDRGGGSVVGLASRAVWRFERRALHAMEMILVDTVANEQRMVADFALPQSKVRSVPLAIPELRFEPCIDAIGKPARPLRVLFVGTLVPLHGIDVVLQAAARLADDARVELRLIGDGQQGPLVERFVKEQAPANFTWIREWQSLETIASEISAADICLGVFGGEGKASRVLPFKLYYALSAGKVVITQEPYSLPEGAPALPAITIPPDGVEKRAEQLAEAVLALAEDRTRINILGEMASRYYHDYLSGGAVIAGWRRCLSDTAD